MRAECLRHSAVNSLDLYFIYSTVLYYCSNSCMNFEKGFSPTNQPNAVIKCSNRFKRLIIKRILFSQGRM